jgi:hypothetical protein
MITRPPAVAGMFYPSRPDILTQQVDDLLERAESRPIPGTIKGLLAPHAGYMYSGFTAAHGYKLLRGQSHITAVLIGPSHREYFDGVSIYSGDAYQTPLGTVMIDTSLRDALAASGHPIIVTSYGHREEHSIEVQLPFLQRVLTDFTILPIIMGEQRREYVETLAEALISTCRDRSVVIVASSDLSHYYPYHIAQELDRIVQEDVSQFDARKLLDDIEHERTEACGGGPLAAMLLATQGLGADRTEILHACNSGDVTGDKTGVVGYLSAVSFQSTTA